MLKYYGIVYNVNTIGVSNFPCSGDCREITKELFDNAKKLILVNNEIVIDPDYDEKERKRIRIREIKEELNLIDLKSIRSIRANDTEYIQKYEQDAIELREELKELEK